MITHSHMDAGWQLSFNGYYSYYVYNILYGVVLKLSEPGDQHTYTVGDMAFFQHFYNKQTHTTKEKVKTLVKEGRLEIVHGGMVSSDEACTNYLDIIRNFEMAHDWI